MLKRRKSRSISRGRESEVITSF